MNLETHSFGIWTKHQLISWWCTVRYPKMQQILIIRLYDFLHCYSYIPISCAVNYHLVPSRNGSSFYFCLSKLVAVPVINVFFCASSRTAKMARSAKHLPWSTLAPHLFLEPCGWTEWRTLIRGRASMTTVIFTGTRKKCLMTFISCCVSVLVLIYIFFFFFLHAYLVSLPMGPRLTVRIPCTKLAKRRA